MNKQPLVSTIVPVYNTVNELERCINSLLNQTYADIEIILVDDGSEDGSGQICDRYAERDNRVKVIHQENAGVVAARKAGVRAAKGEYVSFIDSDDYIDEGMYQRLIKVVEETQADIISFGCIREYATGLSLRVPSAPEYDCIQPGVYDRENMLTVYRNLICYDGYARWGILPFLWSKLFKKAMVERNMESVPKEITIGEDACLVYMCYMDADKVCIVHEAFYHYCMRQYSSVHSVHKKCFSILNACYECLYHKILEKEEYQEILLNQLEMYVAREAIYCLKNRFGFSDGGVLPQYTVTLRHMGMDTRLALYGAGSVGTSYYKQITGLGQADIVLWVDKDTEKVAKNSALSPVEKLLTAEYDYVLIAVKQKSVAEVIKKDLMEMGIAEEKLLWEEPKFILDIF